MKLIFENLKIFPAILREYGLQVPRQYGKKNLYMYMCILLQEGDIRRRVILNQLNDQKYILELKQLPGRNEELFSPYKKSSFFN